MLAGLAGRLTLDRPSGHGRRAIISSSPGELHVLGGQMVADFLEADGWDVLVLGADTPADALARMAAAEQDVVLVALSTALPAHLLAAGAACAALRRLADPPFIVVGGQAFAGDERRALAVGPTPTPTTRARCWRSSPTASPMRQTPAEPSALLDELLDSAPPRCSRRASGRTASCARRTRRWRRGRAAASSARRWASC